MRMPSYIFNSSRLTVHQKAFTVGEVVLSSFILTAGVLSVLSLISFSFRSSVDNQKMIVASELAQEGVELVRNVRDNNLVDKAATGSPTSVFNGFPGGAGTKKCIIDYTSPTSSVNCPAGSVGIELAQDGSGFYRHGIGTGLYYRMIKIDPSSAAADAPRRVQSFVSWYESDPRSFLNPPSATTWCTLANKCVYTEIFLTAWK